MKRLLKKLSVLLMVLIVGFALISCDKTPAKVKVTFKTTDTNVEVFEIDKNTTVNELQAPTREGYEFLYWSLEGEQEFNFETLIAGDIVLVANWRELENYTVTFNSMGGSEVSAVVVLENKAVSKPADPEKEGFIFEYWYLEEGVEFDFSTPITGNITLTAFWSEPEATDREKIEEDIAALEQNFILSPQEVNLIRRGTVNNSTITWATNSPYVSLAGILLPVAYGDTETLTADITGTFRLGSERIERTFTVPLVTENDVTIAEVRTMPFRNMTNEYDVADGSLDLYFEANGSVPYVDLEEFLGLVTGFIDPATVFTFTRTETELRVFYQYYDEEEDHTYDLEVVLDATANTISTNDPGFYWAYVYSTETNYGRHIEYLRNHPDDHYQGGHDLVYELNFYNLDMPVYNGKVLLPYYLANQIFVGSSYYNVYYNGEGLFGIYALPDSDEDAYKTMKKSVYNGQPIPADLRIHNYNMLAFDLDYFYGLKDKMGVETYYDIISARKDSILDKTGMKMEDGIFKVLLLDIDEPHTSYGYPSYYNTPLWPGPSASSLSSYGPRFKKWYMDGFSSVDEVIEAKWGRHDGMSPTAWAARSELRPNYWPLNDEYIVITLDSFSTKDIEETAVNSDELVRKILKLTEGTVLPAVNGGTKYFYYNTGSKEENKLELIVKGLESTYVETFAQAVTSFGYVSVEDEEGTPLDYDLYVLGDRRFRLKYTYDETYKVFYVGVLEENEENIDEEWTVDVPKFIKGDSAVYLEFTMEQILAEYPNVKNITLDLTWNTGGNVGALYRVVGFVTNEPFRVSKMKGDTGSASSSYVKIVGTPTYPHLNWSLLVSPLTFSAGNSLTNIFKENNLGPIIGMQTGGGACSITPILLPSGTAFTMSSNSIEAYRTGSGTEEDPFVYHDVEYGITPDYIIENYSDLLDEEVLLGILMNP